jgi:ABC-type amino acid transport substrate-binding protein
VDAALVDSGVAYYYTAERGKTYYVLPDSLSEENIAVGFRKGDEALRDRVQELIDEMKENGTLAIISTKWFGGDITIVK